MTVQAGFYLMTLGAGLILSFALYAVRLRKRGLPAGLALTTLFFSIPFGYLLSKLVYIICLLVLGLPVMIMEFAMGRASQASPVRMYQKLEKPGQKWHIHGYFALLGNIALMAFYTVVTGWMMYYFVKFLLGQSANLGFVEMITNPGVNVIYLLIAVVLGFGVLSFNLQGGLERVTKYLMTALFVLMVVLAIHSFTLSGAKDGLKFYR